MVSIILEDNNDNATFFTSSTHVTVSEDASPGVSVFTVVADEGRDGCIEYQLLAGDIQMFISQVTSKQRRQDILKLSSKKGAFIQSKVDTLGATCKHIRQTVVKLTTWRRTNRNIFETYRIESSALPSYSPSSFLFRVKHACVYIEL